MKIKRQSKRNLPLILMALLIQGSLFSGIVFSQSEEKINIEINWSEFLQRHDLQWEKLPERWEEAPYLGNGNIGTMIYLDSASNSIRLQLFRVDVQDHRDNSFGWTAYSRPRFMIGSFYLKPEGKIEGGNWRLDLWNATLRGNIKTDCGSISFDHLVHSDDMIVYTGIKTTGDEDNCKWEWIPEKAETTRPGYPHKKSEIAGFAKRYGQHYINTLQLYEPNPDNFIEIREGINVSVQNLLAGGQYAVAWNVERLTKKKQSLVISIEKSYPENTAADQAVANLKLKEESDQVKWIRQHNNWWNNYYPASFVSIPDTRLESFYWHQMYKLASATRKDRPMMDTSGPWIQPTPWPYITWDLNVQLCYWPVYPSNRLHLGESLIKVLHKNRQTLIDNVRPKEWQENSAFLFTVSAQDLVEPRDGDMRYYGAVGHLTWALHNCWLHYRFSMDEDMLREKIYPLLKRSINFYRHMLTEDKDGILHLPKTYSPETKEVPDCNYDLALLKWGCQALIAAAERLNINDPLLPQWKDILRRLTDFPVDQNGFMLGAGAPMDLSHRHFSHLLMAYPLYLVNIDQEPEQRDLIQKSLNHWINFKGALQGYSYTAASSLSAAIGNGNDALGYLKGLEQFLQPNGLYKESGPVMETPLSAAQSIHDMLLQSWNNTIRVFPAAPDAWPDMVFQKLRTEGAFLISAVRMDGKTQFIHIKSLAGEPCRIIPGLDGEIKVSGHREFLLTEVEPHLFTLDIKKGEEVLLWSGDEKPDLSISPLPGEKKSFNSFGLEKY
ncbi:MAG: alpha-L-fucosidase [Bacteroidetes bacterium]|nr:alpha-L-fucosidase [Bacteroidota bacterium]